MYSSDKFTRKKNTGSLLRRDLNMVDGGLDPTQLFSVGLLVT